MADFKDKLAFFQNKQKPKDGVKSTEKTNTKVSKATSALEHEVTFNDQVSGKRPNFNDQVSGKRPNFNDQVSGKQPNSERDFDQVGGRRWDIEHSSESIEPDVSAFMTATFEDAKTIEGVSIEIKGLVMLPQQIVVSDAANCKIRVLDESFSTQYESKCSSRPHDICSLDDNMVVVSSIGGQNLTLLTVGPYAIEDASTIEVKHSCFGVCSHQWEIYCIVSDAGRPSLQVYTAAGKLTKSVQYLNDGKVELDKSGYITVNPRTGILYVTDWNHGVVALTADGEVITTFSIPFLKNPQGVSLDGNGNIYVCGCDSNNVIQMSEDGEHVMRILSDTENCKHVQCIEISENKLYLSRRGFGIVSIYMLC